MNPIRSSSFLRLTLLADAIVSGTTRVIMALFATPLAGLLGVPALLLEIAGLALLPFVAIVAWLATRDVAPRAGVWAVIALNVLWAMDSMLLLFTGWVDPTVLGHTFIVGQALIVAAFAEAQYMGLRRATPIAA